MNITSLILALLLISVPKETKQAQNTVFEKITKAFNSGDYKLLCSTFNSVTEVVIDGDESTISPKESEMVFKNFFTQNKPKEFKLLHSGGNDNSKYGIGNYKSEVNMYRVYFLVKKSEGKPLVHQLRIEKE